MLDISIEAYTERLETDEEYKDHIKEEKEREETLKRRELEQLERLKAKYDKQ